jgi:hypothetical protein
MHNRKLRRGAGWSIGAIALWGTLMAGPAPAQVGGIGTGSPPPANPAVDPSLLTVAERSDWTATALHADVVALLDALASASPLARRGSLGTSSEGRDLPTLMLSDPPVSTAGEARALAEREGRLIVLAIGNIHAGEVDGKEGLPMLARQLLGLEPAPGRDLRGVLKQVIVVLAPIYNADGNERVGAAGAHRPGQVGPSAGMGIRENAAGLDLNRDFIKAESPEGASLIRFMVEWDPHLFIDCHTTNGSFHRYVLTYAGPKAPAGDAAINAYSRETFLPALGAMFDASTPYRSFWYGSFEGAFGDGPRATNAHTRWETFPAEGRYGTTYVGLRQRLSVLSEGYSYAPYHDRVIATRELVRCAIELAAEHRAAIRSLVRDADDRAIRRGRTAGEAGDLIVLRSKAAPWPEKVDVLGFEEEEKDGRVINTGRPKTYRVELWDRFEATLTTTRPWGYLIRSRPGTEALVAKLRQHGIRVDRLGVPLEGLEVERLTVTAAEPASRKFQNHVLVRVDTNAEAAKGRGEAGDHLVPAGQRLGNLACYLLEPSCEDGLATWNFFDAWLQVGTVLPVERVMKAPLEAPASK